MAVKQDRILAILSTTRRFYNDLLAIKTQIRQLTAAVPPNASREDLLSLVHSFQFMVDQFRPAEKDLQLLLAEEAHFKTNARRNERAAEYARRRRAGLPSTFKGLDGEIAEAITSAGISKPGFDAFPSTTTKTSSALLASYKPLDSDTPPDSDGELF